MAKIPQTDSTIARIYRAYEERENGSPRAHLGASIVGRECEREAWSSFRWLLYPEYEGRILRLFDRGKREEPVLIHDLRSAGVTVHAVDPESGRQFSFSDFGGHFGGSMDGAAVGLVEAPKTWHVLEFKTHGAKSFSALVKNGVEETHPEHFAQMQLYMGWAGMDRAYYLAVSKDTDELYAERIKFDRALFEKLRVKAKRIIFTSEPPPRISEDPEHFRCRLCHFHRVCHGTSFPKANCRTCAHSTPREDGTWHCGRHDRMLSKDDQLAGCPQHVFIPPLVPMRPIQAKEGWVCYLPERSEADGEERDDIFVYNAEEGVDTPPDGVRFASAELQHLTLEQLPAVVAAKFSLGGKVTHAA